MSKEEILELINAGFAPELIELEFNVPIEKINKYIKQEEKRKEKAKKLKPTKTEASPTVTKKEKTNNLDILRKNYNKLTSTHTSESESTYQQPTEEEQAKANTIIKNLQNNLKSIKQMQASQRKEKRQTLSQMIAELKVFFQSPKSIDQLHQIRAIFQSTELENLAISRDDKINLKLTKTRKNIDEELSLLIEQMANQTNDLDELNALYKKIPLAIHGNNTLLANSTRTKLESKMTQLRTAKTMYNIRNNISPEIEDLLRSISDNTFDLEVARKTIAKEAQRRVDNSPKTTFAIPLDRQKRQVEIQISTLISEQGTKYPITNPGLAINNLMQLFSERDKENSFRRVIENLNSQRKYDEAKELCSKYIVKRSFDSEEPSMSKTARSLYRNVILTQIGNMIMDQVRKPSNREEDTTFMNLLEEKMSKERITPAQIVIDITPGGKKIYLKDIWYTNTRMQK